MRPVSSETRPARSGPRPVRWEASGVRPAAGAPAAGSDAENDTVLIVEDHALLAQTLVIALGAEGCRARGSPS